MNETAKADPVRARVNDDMVAAAERAYEREALAGATHEQAWRVALETALVQQAGAVEPECTCTADNMQFGRCCKLNPPQPAVPEEVARDAARYRWLRRKARIVGGAGFQFVNLPAPTYVAPDAAIELDAAIDAQHNREGE